MVRKRTILFYLFSVVSRFCVLILMKYYVSFFVANNSAATLTSGQVVSNSIIFNLVLLSSFKLVFSFLSFKISASRNFNLL